MEEFPQNTQENEPQEESRIELVKGLFMTPSEINFFVSLLKENENMLKHYEGIKERMLSESESDSVSRADIVQELIQRAKELNIGKELQKLINFFRQRQDQMQEPDPRAGELLSSLEQGDMGQVSYILSRDIALTDEQLQQFSEIYDKAAEDRDADILSFFDTLRVDGRVVRKISR